MLKIIYRVSNLVSIMKVSTVSFFLCFCILLSTKPILGQESEEYSIILKPMKNQGLDTDWDGKRIRLSDNGLSIGITVSANAYETNYYPNGRESNSDATENKSINLEKELILYNITSRISLNTSSENISVFIDGVGVSFSSEIHNPEKTSILYYSLPSDTTKIFMRDNPYSADFPYQVTLFYPRFQQKLSNDTLNIDLHLPIIQTPEGNQIMESRVIKLEGIIKRN